MFVCFAGIYIKNQNEFSRILSIQGEHIHSYSKWFIVLFIFHE